MTVEHLLNNFRADERELIKETLHFMTDGVSFEPLEDKFKTISLGEIEYYLNNIHDHSSEIEYFEHVLKRELLDDEYWNFIQLFNERVLDFYSITNGG